MIKEGTFVNISGVAIALAQEHGVSKDQDVRAGFLQKLDERMDASGPGDGLVKLLNSFRKNHLRMGLVTFMRQPRLARRLEQWKLASYFQSVVTPEQLGEFKPSPKPFVKAVKELKVDPADCHVVGDEPVDMAGGKAAGMRTVGLPQGFFSEEELREAGADVIIQSLSMLPDVLKL
jgi:HAD superfamily hydrolase (TIGR01549 family)